MKLSLFSLSSILSTSLIFVTSISYANSMVTKWHQIMLDSMTEESTVNYNDLKPPVYARMGAIFSTCMYDAWTVYDPIAKPTMDTGIAKLPPSQPDQEKAVSFAAYHCLKDQMPDRTDISKRFMEELGYDINDTSQPAMIGTQIANAITTYRHHDGANQLGDLHPGPYSDYTNYQPVNTVDQLNDPNRWQPIRFPDGAGGTFVPSFLTPHWRFVKPFALTDRSQFLPPQPYLHPDRGYIRQAAELVRTSANLNDRTKAIAEFWEEEKPGTFTAGPHWDVFAKFISMRDNYSLEQDIKLFFVLNNAMLDASIAAWDSKVYYDYVRPISAIRFLSRNIPIRTWAGPCKGTQRIPGNTWIPYRNANRPTPPFAEYISGHSAFGGAGAEILKLFTGSDRFDYSVTIPRGSSDIEGLAVCPSNPVPSRDLTLTYNTFSAAASDDAKSRLYMGVHFEAATLEGVKMGRKVANVVWQKAQTLFNGG